jgi:hypothetical protein
VDAALQAEAPALHKAITIDRWLAIGTKSVFLLQA